FPALPLPPASARNCGRAVQMRRGASDNRSRSATLSDSIGCSLGRLVNCADMRGHDAPAVRKPYPCLHRAAELSGWPAVQGRCRGEIPAKRRDHRAFRARRSRRGHGRSIGGDLLVTVKNFRISIADRVGAVEEELVQGRDVVRRQCPVISGELRFDFLDYTRIVYDETRLADRIGIAGHDDFALRRTVSEHNSFRSWRRRSIEGASVSLLSASNFAFALAMSTCGALTGIMFRETQIWRR